MGNLNNDKKTKAEIRNLNINNFAIISTLLLTIFTLFWITSPLSIIEEEKFKNTIAENRTSMTIESILILDNPSKIKRRFSIIKSNYKGQDLDKWLEAVEPLVEERVEELYKIEEWERNLKELEIIRDTLKNRVLTDEYDKQIRRLKEVISRHQK